MTEGGNAPAHGRAPLDDRAVGFVGIGNMGTPMSANLAKAGFEVALFDADFAKARAQAEALGLRAAGSLEELGGLVSIVITMLPTGRDVRAVMLEQEGGLAAFLPPGALVIDMSSSDPIGTRELGEALAARDLQLIDAPVSGAVPRARDGTLTIMIGGGEPAAIERAKPVLAAMGKQLFPTGPLGSGHAMKALNNFVAAAGFAAASEALLAGQRFGLDPAVMVDIMNVSSGRNFSTELTIKPQVLSGAFASGFALALLAKDVKIAADMADALALDLPVLRLTSERWQEALDDLGAGIDHTAAFAAWRARAGVGPDGS